MTRETRRPLAPFATIWSFLFHMKRVSIHDQAHKTGKLLSVEHDRSLPAILSELIELGAEKMKAEGLSFEMAEEQEEETAEA